MEFFASKPSTVGLELEIQLVNRDNLCLKDSAPLVLKRLPEHFKGVIQKEFLKSMLEIVSKPADRAEDAVEEIFQALLFIKKLGSEIGFEPVLLGTHPLAQPSQVSVTEDSRYLEFLKEYQHVLRNFLVFGLHIHCGVENQKALISLHNLSLSYLPIFVALSASSPFFRAEFTGLNSYRLKIFEQLPRAGVPQGFSDFSEFETLIELLKTGGVIKKLKDVWWDVRPRPDFGTVELRVCDANPSRKRIKAVAELMAALGMLAHEEFHSAPFQQIARQNRWNAIRHGFKASFLTPQGTKPLLKVLEELLNRLSKLKIDSELKIDLNEIYELSLKKSVAEKMTLAYLKGLPMEKLVRFGFIERNNSGRQ